MGSESGRLGDVMERDSGQMVDVKESDSGRMEDVMESNSGLLEDETEMDSGRMEDVMESDSGLSSDSLPPPSSPDTVTILVNGEEPEQAREPVDWSVLAKLRGPEEGEVAPVAYITNVSLASVCLCCAGQQARRCSLNVGEYVTIAAAAGRGERLRRSCSGCSGCRVPGARCQVYIWTPGAR
jgi:hypothetical protein